MRRCLWTSWPRRAGADLLLHQSPQPPNDRHVNAWSAHDLCLLEPELLDNQLGVPEVGLESKAPVGAAHDPVEDLALSWLLLPVFGFAAAYSLRLDLILLGQNGLEPIKIGSGSRTAVIISVHQCPYVTGGMVEHRRVPHTPDKTVLNQMVGESLLPVQCRVPGAIKAQSQSPEHVGAGARVLSRDLDVQRPRHLGVEVRAGDIIDHDLPFRPADFNSRRSAEDSPKSLEWRCARV